MDWLKDERRPIEKIYDGKTRMFNIHSVAWLIVNRMYYGAYVACYLATRFPIGSTLGINMHGYDVTEFINYLLEVGDKCWDGDIKKWDGGLDNEVLYDNMLIVAAWLCRYDPTAVYLDIVVVGSSLFWRIHICGNTVYIPYRGMPSGALLTSVFNTGTHNERKYLTWSEICRNAQRTELAYPRHFDNYCREGKNGDDSVGCVSDEVADFYHPDAIQKVFANHGIEFVPPTKIAGAAFGSFRDITEVQFLKSTFRRDTTHQRFWHMCMEKKTIHELTNWIRRGQLPLDALESNIEDGLTFAYAHGQEYFESFKFAVQNALDSQKIDLLIGTTFEERDTIWKTEHDLGLKP